MGKILPKETFQFLLLAGDVEGDTIEGARFLLTNIGSDSFDTLFGAN
jgi:hypothetical protein